MIRSLALALVATAALAAPADAKTTQVCPRPVPGSQTCWPVKVHKDNDRKPTTNKYRVCGRPTFDGGIKCFVVTIRRTPIR